MAECQLPKLNVAGSSPVSRSNLKRAPNERALQSKTTRPQQYLHRYKQTTNCQSPSPLAGPGNNFSVASVAASLSATISSTCYDTLL